VVRHHVAGQAHATLRGAFAQVRTGCVPAQVVRHDIVIDGIGGRHGLRVAHQLLDALGSRAALPQADQPQTCEAAPGEGVQLFVRNLIQPRDQASVLAGELIQPDIGVLGDQDGLGHPVQIRGKAFFLQRQRGVVVDAGRARAGEGDPFLLADHVEPAQQALDGTPEEGSPPVTDVGQLAGQRVR